MLRQEAERHNEATIKELHQLLKGLNQHLGTTKCKHCRKLLEQIFKEA